MLIKLALIALVLTGCAGWTKNDTYRHTALTALIAVDYAQTMKIAREPENFKENNPILGEHPSEQEVTLYFASAYALTTATAMLLPPEYRKWFQYIVIGGQVGVVANNFHVGLGFGF